MSLDNAPDVEDVPARGISEAGLLIPRRKQRFRAAAGPAGQAGTGPRVLLMIRVRFRLRFRKREDLRWISHHDLVRTVERWLRRAGLPLRRSEGFHPKPKLSFPSALALGIAALDEVMEFELTEAGRRRPPAPAPGPHRPAGAGSRGSPGSGPGRGQSAGPASHLRAARSLGLPTASGRTDLRSCRPRATYWFRRVGSRRAGRSARPVSTNSNSATANSAFGWPPTSPAARVRARYWRPWAWPTWKAKAVA